jgi:hypothetical protein
MDKKFYKYSRFIKEQNEFQMNLIPLLQEHHSKLTYIKTSSEKFKENMRHVGLVSSVYPFLDPYVSTIALNSYKKLGAKINSKD